MVRTRRPVVLSDIAHNPSIPVGAYREYLLARGVQAVLVAPLLLGPKVIGGLAIHNNERDYWRPEEIELAQALTQQASLAVQLTRLAEQGSREAQQAAVAEERNRMAREIHDTLAQGFTGIVVQLEAAEDALGSPTAPPNSAGRDGAMFLDAVQAHLSRARELARKSLTEARRSVWALRPQALLDGGDLGSVFGRLLEQMTLGTTIQTTCDVDGVPYPLPPPLENNLLRIGQEALTNTLKHAQAGRIAVQLVFAPEEVRLSIHDDGRGFDTDRARGFGVTGMRERAQSLGATLQVDSASGQGTVVSVCMPVATFVRPGPTPR